MCKNDGILGCLVALSKVRKFVLDEISHVREASIFAKRLASMILSD